MVWLSFITSIYLPCYRRRIEETNERIYTANFGEVETSLIGHQENAIRWYHLPICPVVKYHKCIDVDERGRPDESYLNRQFTLELPDNIVVTSYESSMSPHPIFSHILEVVDSRILQIYISTLLWRHVAFEWYMYLLWMVCHHQHMSHQEYSEFLDEVINPATYGKQMQMSHHKYVFLEHKQCLSILFSLHKYPLFKNAAALIQSITSTAFYLVVK